MNTERTTESAPISDAELTPTESVSITSLATSVFGLLGEQLQERLQLFRLEVQQAVSSLIGMLVCGLVGAFLLVSLWLMLAAASLCWLLEQGMATSSALFIISVGNGLAIGGVMIRYRRYQQNICIDAVATSNAPMPSDESSTMPGAPL
ncbi:hypothetical protein [Aeromonas salmonicida]|uniref:hypothetical protein n=1 Tax=Aeromonas salmonicida TaxID=645 RepID=UPI00259EE253|nr:hypothetical protein [Aeromonas salmonicida]MDM5101124.1 hypothetical protein [Aeromonas salmonicida]